MQDRSWRRGTKEVHSNEKLIDWLRIRFLRVVNFYLRQHDDAIRKVCSWPVCYRQVYSRTVTNLKLTLSEKHLSIIEPKHSVL